MAQQAPIGPENPLYEVAQNVDLTKVPEKLICKNCSRFLLNAFKAACCDGSLCETCNTAAVAGACPLCKHEPLISSASKALRGTARNYLRSEKANADAKHSTELTPSIPATVSRESVFTPVQESVLREGMNGKDAGDDQSPEKESAQPVDEQPDQSTEVFQSIEEPRETSRRPTINSTSGNEPDDDDIEINVGPDYDLSQVPEPRRSPLDEDGWQGEQQFFHEKSRKNSTMPQKQDHNPDKSFNYENNSNSSMNKLNPGTLPSEPNSSFSNGMMPQNGMDPFNMSMMNTGDPSAMLAQMMNNFQQNYHLMSNMSGMQGMGMQMPQMPMGMGMSGFQNWQNMMPNFGNSNFNMTNNGPSYNQGYPNQNFDNGDFRPQFANGRNGSFQGRGNKRGKFAGRGRGQYGNNNFQQYNNHSGNSMPLQNQNQYGPPSMNYLSSQHGNQSPGDAGANDKKDDDANDDEFAPGGQDEIREALGDSYSKKASVPPEESKVEHEPAEHIKQEEYQQEPSSIINEPPTLVNSPKQEPKEEYIPEAYREDLDFNSATAPPFSAPSGPSSKDVPYRARGHGRFPSRGRGSYNGTNAYPPRSPARPVSQPQNTSPPTNHKPGVIGAPTGPRAMRQQDAPIPPSIPKAPARSESDVGFKIRGTATQSKDLRSRDELPRSVTPRSTYDDHDDRDRDSSRRHSKHDRKYESSRHHDDANDYEADRDHTSKRRKSRRDDGYDHDMADADYSHSHSRSDSADRTTSHRNSGRRDREKEKEKERTRDKYSSSTSKHKSSSRKHDDEYDDHNGANDYGEESRTSKPSKKSSKYDDREKEDRERRDRDYERAEKDKRRKRSRHDRDRDDEYEDADEDESRRRSRKHKKEHTSSSSRKDKREDRYEEDADLGMRITGRGSHRSSEVPTPTQPHAQPDKDPHTLERERRNQERMLKEQQRREAAKSSSLSGGRTRNVKYEDEIDRSLSFTKPSRRR